MDSSQSTRPASQLVAGFASPSTPASARRSLRQSTQTTHSQPLPQHPLHDAEKDELRVQVSTLRYELENIKQEQELQTLQHEKETREIQIKADADFRKAQAAESASNRAINKSETLAKELKEAQEQALTDRTSLERKNRTLQDERQTLQEELDDSQARLSDQERHSKYQINELETVRASLQKTIEEFQNDLHAARTSQQTTQEKLTQRESEVAELESENIRLKSEGSDAEELAVLKRELSEQVSHIRELETTGREQGAELQYLRKVQKNVEVVQEQKRSLENQLMAMKDLEAEVGTLQIQKQVLEDERQSWTSLLENNNQSAEFDSPEAVVKALAETQIEMATLVDRLGTVDAQFLEKDEAIKILENEKATLRQEIEKLRASSSANGSTAAPAAAEARAKSRLERQRVLAVKEVEYLRAQLKAFDEEEITMNEEKSYDEQKAEQIAQLQKIVDEYRNELQTAHEELSKREAPPPPAQDDSQARGTKRPLSSAEGEVDSERLSVLTRKNRKLQEALSKAEQATTLGRRELDAAKSQIKSLKSKSRTRVLELRENPTAEAEKIKMSTLATLRSENQALLAQLRGENTGVKAVPVSTLDSLKLEMQDMDRVVADKEKRMRRLKEIWTAKSSEFREAVASLLGFKLDFLPNGRVRVTSMFHLSSAYRHGDGDDPSNSRGAGSMGDGGENSIVFDGENGTMKISGGPNSLFAMEIKHLIKFWVEERKDIPCFLAAMTLDFYDKTTRAARI
ncbi:Spindle-related protein [Penicillium waksmanii]|uniref:Spindle-related protein n=1 Tax=Penicillium waksmanii TaxID=69791 RepID=UPI002548E136|nr:Spindle-related protein [Penicillium waksmanii]KAJ5975665.1 Spindle-related protein [Penicillium waksmanii]